MSAVPRTGARRHDWATLVLAPNPGLMTLTGTNTWVLAASSSGDCVVVDPGPADARHLEAVLAATAARRVRAVLVTHGHHDHVDGLAELLDRIEQVRRALADGADGPDDVVARVYPDLTGTLRDAAVRTVRATLVYLDAEHDAR